MKKMTLMLLSVVLTLSSSGWAAPLNRTHVPAGAKWLLHVDFEVFARTEMWRLIDQEISEEVRIKIKEIETFSGIDPTKDIYGATLYGTELKEENVVITIYARYDKERLLTMLAYNEFYRESEYNGRTLYHWVDDNDKKHMVGMFATDGMIVISQSEQAIQNTADVLAGQVNSLTSQEDAPLAALVDAPEDAFLVLVAEGLTEILKDNQDVEILQNSKSMSVVVGEKNGEIYLHVKLTANTTEAAMQIEEILSGIKAFVELKNAEQPEVMLLLQAINLEQKESKLFLSFKYSSAKLFEIAKIIKNSMDEKKTKEP